MKKFEVGDLLYYFRKAGDIEFTSFIAYRLPNFVLHGNKMANILFFYPENFKNRNKTFKIIRPYKLSDFENTLCMQWAKDERYTLQKRKLFSK